MRITKLQIHNLRNFQHIELFPSPHLNLVVGENGSGKTSLLESIYILGTGKSFRESTLRNVIRKGESETILFTEFEEGGHKKTIGICKGMQHSKVKLNGERLTNNTELAINLPLQLIHPESQKLVNGSPGDKRQFLDWGVFHVEPSYPRTWKEFRKILKQRNSALQQGLSKDMVDVWDEQFIAYANDIHLMRAKYLAGLRPFISSLLEQLMELSEIDIQYYPGWSEAESLEDQLAQAWPRDRKVLHTTVGPQRADLPMQIDHVSVDKWLSRGQQKLFAAVLLLAQQAFLKSERQRDCLLLVDDLPAELDDHNRNRFLEVVRRHNVQTFITATKRDLLTMHDGDKWFHVKHGMLD